MLSKGSDFLDLHFKNDFLKEGLIFKCFLLLKMLIVSPFLKNPNPSTTLNPERTKTPSIKMTNQKKSQRHKKTIKKPIPTLTRV